MRAGSYSNHMVYRSLKVSPTEQAFVTITLATVIDIRGVSNFFSLSHLHPGDKNNPFEVGN